MMKSIIFRGIMCSNHKLSAFALHARKMEQTRVACTPWHGEGGSVTGQKLSSEPFQGPDRTTGPSHVRLIHHSKVFAGYYVVLSCGMLIMLDNTMGAHPVEARAIPQTGKCTWSRKKSRRNVCSGGVKRQTHTGM